MGRLDALVDGYKVVALWTIMLDILAPTEAKGQATANKRGQESNKSTTQKSQTSSNSLGFGGDGGPTKGTLHLEGFI